MAQLLRNLLAGCLHVLANRATRLEQTLVVRAQAAVALDRSDRPASAGRAAPSQAEDGPAEDGRADDGRAVDGEAGEFAGPPPEHWLARARGNPPTHWPGATPEPRANRTSVAAPALARAGVRPGSRTPVAPQAESAPPSEVPVDPAGRPGADHRESGAASPRRPAGYDRPRKAWEELVRRTQGALDGWKQAGRTKGKPSLPTEVREPEVEPTTVDPTTEAPADGAAKSEQTRDPHRPGEGPAAASAKPDQRPSSAADSSPKPTYQPVEPSRVPDDLSTQANGTAPPWDPRAAGRVRVDVPSQREHTDRPGPPHGQPRHDAPPYDRPRHDQLPPTHPGTPVWFWIPTTPDTRPPAGDPIPPATDPWPALPDDKSLWIPPDTAFSDSDQLRRLDDEQRGS